jgi:hypothetical protein
MFAVEGRRIRMARPLPLTTFLCGVAIILGACGSVPNPVHLVESPTVPNPLYWLHSNVIAKPDNSQRVAEPDEMPMPVERVSLTMGADYEQQIKDLDADNLKLKKQLADAQIENAKLKKQLNEAMEDNSLLKDLAARKMR